MILNSVYVFFEGGGACGTILEGSVSNLSAWVLGFKKIDVIFVGDFCIHLINICESGLTSISCQDLCPGATCNSGSLHGCLR